MDHLSDIEKKLAQLVPPALSEHGQRKLEDVIDDLAGVESVSARSHWRGGLKVAAIVAVLAVPVVLFQWGGAVKGDHSMDIADVVSFPEMELLTASSRIDGQENDGLIVPVNGTAPHYRYRYRVVEEEKVRDSETGMVVTLRQPRHEVLTIQATSF